MPLILSVKARNSRNDDDEMKNKNDFLNNIGEAEFCCPLNVTTAYATKVKQHILL